MTYEGFLRIGGVEVVNTERARGYTTTTDCPERWVSSETECLTLGDAMGDASYDFADINDAPWYDGSLSDLSSRFYGVVGLDISGPTDSTRAASRTEGVNDGGVIGRTRKGMRGLRVRATIMARGRDALDYGSQWLSSVFDGTCSQHGDACSTTDAEFLAECPPPRGTVSDFTAWMESRRNLWRFPGDGAVTGWSSYRTAIAFSGGFIRGTINTTPAPAGASGIVAQNTAAAMTVAAPGDVWSAAAELRADGVGKNVAIGIQFYDASFAFIAGSQYLGATIAGDPTEWRVAKVTTPAAPAGTAYFRLVALRMDASAIGETIDLRRATAVKAAVIGAPFSANMASTDLTRYTWAGAANASESIEETRATVERPRTDAEYAQIVDPLRRFVHDIAVTSGPLDVEEFEPSRGFYGKTVEFTITSERAWVYGITKPLTLTPTLPSVVQDTPYNLIPYPSAELASGLITVATNLSTNPSVETNVTGWVMGVGAGGITTGMIASSRVVNELAASGTGSFRVVFTATGASATAGEFTGQQLIAVNTLAAGTRVSIGLWAAEVLMAGSPVRLPLRLEAVWMDGSSNVLRTDLLGEVPVNGGAASLTGLTIPAGAFAVLIRARARLSSWDAATVLRLYVDALSLTVP